MIHRTVVRCVAVACLFGSVSRAPAEPAPANEPDGRWRERLNQTREKRAAAEEERRLRADLHFDAGTRLYNEGRLVQAQAEFAKAADLGHAEAAASLRKVNAILDVGSDRYGNALDELRKRHGAQLDMLLFEIDRGLAEGDQWVRSGRFDRAIGAYEKVRDQVRFLPMEVPDRATKLARVEGSLKEARVSHEQVRAEDERRKQEEAKRLIRDAEVAQQALLRQRIDRMLSDAEAAYQRQKYDFAILLADQVLQEDPGNLDAADIKRRARTSAHLSRMDRTRVEIAHQNRGFEAYMEELRTPYDPEVKVEFPDNWLSVRAYRESRGQGFVAPEEPWKRSIRERLARPVGPFDNSEMTVNQILRDLSARSGLNIKVDPAVERNMDLDRTTLNQFLDRQGTVPLEQKLTELCDHVDLKWTLKYGGIFISNEEGVRGEMQTVFRDVKDLLVRPLDFSAPQTGFASTGGSPFGGDGDEPTTEGLDLERIVELINLHVPEIGKANGEVTEVEETQQISIRAPIELLRKVDEVLEGLRSQQSLLVDVQARFLRLEHDLADEIGITWQGLPGRTITAPGIDAGDSSGILNSPGRRVDVRYLSNPGTGAYLDTPFKLGGAGRSGNFTGAAGFLRLSYLNDWQAAMIVKAIHATRRGSIVHSPHLKMFNTQRAYMVVLREKTYIRDVAAQVGGLGGAALDPEIGTIREGTSFEVRPVVSADRKFITLELRPTQAEVVNIREINVAAALGPGATAATTPINIEAPEIELRQIRTTVTVPDNGTILLGGLTAYSAQHQYMGLPGISKIPILNFLFGRDIQVKERNSLMIMVRAQVVDNQEEEERRFGRR